MQVQEEMVRKAILRSEKVGKKRVYSSIDALLSIVYCDHYGDIYRRVHWNNEATSLFFGNVPADCVWHLNDVGFGSIIINLYGFLFKDTLYRY